MKISELIKCLDDFKKEHGDINCVCSDSHDYWGSVFAHLLTGYNFSVCNHAQPEGPKSEMEKAVVFGEV